MLKDYLERTQKEAEKTSLSPRDIAINEIMNLHQMKELNPSENEYSFSSALTIPIGYIDSDRKRYSYDKLYGNTESGTFVAHYGDRCLLIRTVLSPDEYSFAQENIDRLHRNAFLNFEYEKEGLKYSSVIGFQEMPKTYSKLETDLVSFNVIG
jgi:hypothetical protein